MGIAFDVASPSVNEDALPGESPSHLVERLALAKARTVYGDQGDRVVIGADSVVVLDDRILGKPGSSDDARSMLTALRGREHDVYTGVAVVGPNGEAVSSKRSRVVMREYSDAELEDYVSLRRADGQGRRLCHTGPRLPPCLSFGRLLQ